MVLECLLGQVERGQRTKYHIKWQRHLIKTVYKWRQHKQIVFISTWVETYQGIH